MFRKRLNNQMAPALLQVILSCYANFPKNSFSIFAFTYEKHIESKKTVLLAKTTKCAFYPNAEIAFFSGVTLKISHRNWTHCVPYINTGTVFMYSSGIDSVGILLPIVVRCLIMCRSSLFLSKKHRSGQNARIAKKRLLRNKYRKHSLSSF